MVCQIL